MKRHKGAEQRARKNWGNRQDAAYDYRDDSDVEYQIPTKTRRTDGGRERALPERSKKRQASKRDLSVFDFSSDDPLADDDSDSDSDSSLLVGQVVKESLCTCGGGSTHGRSCPANVRNLGSHKTPSTTREPGTCNESDVSERACEDHGESVSLSDKASSTIAKPNADENLGSGSKEPQPARGDGSVDLSDEVRIMGIEFTASCPVVGSPGPTTEWQKEAGAFLTELTKKTVRLRDQRINKVGSPDIPAGFVRDKIVGDGNCLFRAIAKAVTGTEANHTAVREAVCEFMLLDSNVHNFRPLTLSLDDSDPKIVVGNYIKKQRMRKDGAWGTDTEIHVVATMLQINIFVNIVGGYGVRSFVPYRPVFANDTCMPCCDPMPCIYLYHVNIPRKEHYDLVHLPS